ncbi:MAG: PepSY domain-containing protein [Planctomycetota bacterium]
MRDRYELIDTKLKRVFWAWHFWAGLIATPVLVVLSITGGIYVFKPQLERWWYADIAAARFEILDLQLDAAVDQVEALVGEEHAIYGFELESDTGRAPAVLTISQDGHYSVRRFFFHPDTQQIRGEIPEPNFFTVTLDLHRRLAVGTLGRVLTELTTCWTVSIMLLGLVLWWPKNLRRLGGIFWPRIRSKRYVQLRDLHAVGGALAAPLLLIIAVTGLLYALVWGGVFFGAGLLAGQFDVKLSPPQSTSDESKPTLSANEILARMHALEMPTDRVSIHMPMVPTDPISIESGHHWGASVSRIVFLDRASGKLLLDRGLSELPPMAVYTQWNYPLHVGSVMGLGSQILWLIASVLMAALPVLGVAMWLVRRKRGRTGFPKRGDAIKPAWLVAAMTLLGILLPTAGISMLLVWACLTGSSRVRGRAAKAATSS